MDRFTTYVSNLLPRIGANQAYHTSGDGAETTLTATSSATKRRVVIAGHKSAISFASQFVKTETGRNPYDFGDYIRGLQVYGYAVTKPEALAIAYVA